jgi:hypothetical protein
MLTAQGLLAPPLETPFKFQQLPTSCIGFVPSTLYGPHFVSWLPLVPGRETTTAILRQFSAPINVWRDRGYASL